MLRSSSQTVKTGYGTERHGRSDSELKIQHGGSTYYLHSGAQVTDRRAEGFMSVRVETQTHQGKNERVYGLDFPFSITVDGKTEYSVDKDFENKDATLEATKKAIALTNELKAIGESAKAGVKGIAKEVIKKLRNLLS